jgi:hypothetical protein
VPGAVAVRMALVPVLQKRALPAVDGNGLQAAQVSSMKMPPRCFFPGPEMVLQTADGFRMPLAPRR